ncbi:MAG: diacylglycerol kinase family protein [Oscillospiraceae bacterium]|nr:diacylglycerol kinase family protein [Oscillospiraceae bacterium]
MKAVYVLYNPLSGNGKGEEDAKLLDIVFPYQVSYYDITKITNYAAFLGGLEKDGILILVGGDGTLNRFANDTEGINIQQEIFYFPVGTGNDFARELGRETYSEPFPIARYLKNLPTVSVNGKSYRFLNGVGFGIDGYCCQEGDRLREIPGKKINYTAIAVKGLLSNFAPRKAKVTVDGREYTYKKVWIAPTMYGRFYGGGMIPAPGQNRDNPDKTLSLMVFHGAGRLRTLCAFPGIFKGKHVKHKKMVDVHRGHEIKVEFGRSTPLQIDGETIPNVTCYIARSALCGNAKNEYNQILACNPC